MIKISLSNETKKAAEAAYWKWFKTFHLENFKITINSDTNFKSIMLGDKVDDTSIQKWLFASPDRLKDYKDKLDSSAAKGLNISQVTVDYLLERYENFRNSQAGKIYLEMGVNVCPYCNMNMLNIGRDKNGKLKFWGQADHFYNKSSYPALAICLYNLVPSCGICNNVKSDSAKTIINPYTNTYAANISFKTELKKPSRMIEYTLGLTDEFEIKLDKSGAVSKAVEEELKMFNIEERYKNLKPQVKDIARNAYAYHEAYLDNLEDNFIKIGMPKDFLKETLFGFAEDDNEKPLSKFKKDIMREFL